MQHPSWRASYLLLASLMLPMGTVVLVALYFGRIAGRLSQSGILDAGSVWALNLLAIAAGISAAMALVLDVSLLILYRQRNRFQRLYGKQHTFLNSMLEERLRMTRSLDVLGAVHQVTLAIKQENSFERIASVVLEQIEFFSRADDVVVFAEGTDGELHPRARRWMGISTFGSGIDETDIAYELPCQAALRGQPQRHFNQPKGLYGIALPYSTPDGLRGVIQIARDASDDPDFVSEMDQFETSLIQLVKGVSAGLKFAAVWDRAIKDEATGLYNKNHFNKELPKILQSTLRHGQPFSMIMLDIDKFKHVNDTFGHIPGDQILAQVSGLMLENLRDGDMAFRYGGEELCILALNTVGEDAGAYAERLRTSIAHTEFRTSTGQLIPITSSLGVAEFDPIVMKGEKELKEACDSALYNAKEHGRNMTVIFESIGKFRPIDRTGDVNSEVKRRLGLAGDNQPLESDEDAADRRAAIQKSGKVGKAIRNGEVELLDDKMVTSESMRLDPGRSIRKLAEQIIAAADDNDQRLAEVARIAEVAAVAMQEQRTSKRLASLDEEAIESAAPPAKKRQRRKKAAKKITQQVVEVVSDALIEPAAKLRLVSKKSKRVSAKQKAVEAISDANRHASDESDRLDFITEDEANQLLVGEAPKKSARNAAVSKANAPATRKSTGKKATRKKSTESKGEEAPPTSAGWNPVKHW